MVHLIDYLHNHIGCDFITPNSQGNLNAYTLNHVIQMITEGKRVQLVLKPLTKMTAVDLHRVIIKEFNLTDQPIPPNQSEAIEELVKHVRVVGLQAFQFCPEHFFMQPFLFSWLAGMGYDVYRLIEAGHAVELLPSQVAPG
jgi:hypothetical protein